MIISASDIKYPARYKVQIGSETQYLCDDHLQVLENKNKAGEVIEFSAEYLATEFISCNECANLED